LAFFGEIVHFWLRTFRGYLNNKGLTCRKVWSNPFTAGARVYKTGDLGRWLPDGSIEFFGT
jgi:non-ribosomal peptide synthetase component F